MKNLLLLTALFTLSLCSLAYAQCNEDPNEIGVFWTEDCADCIICKDCFGVIAIAYVILINPTQPGGVSGFECCLANVRGATFLPPPGVIVNSYNLPPGGINALTPPCFAVGMASPIPWSPCITLLSIEFLVMSLDPFCFGVKPAVPASLPGHMAYADGMNPGLLLPMYPNNGPDAPDYAMACLNSPECPPYPVAVQESSWGTLKSLYR